MTKDAVSNLAMAMYANEPCRICGQNISHEDVGDAVFAGYSEDSRSRAAHRRCWRGFRSVEGAIYEAWKNDRSVARPYEEFRAEMGLA